MRASLAFVIALIATSGSGGAAENLVREVRHELLLVQGYTVFDWLAYRIDGAKVTLLGAVVNASLKRDAENAVKKIEGAEDVENDIEVLPDSASDDRIRHAVLASINKQLVRYQVAAVQSLHIVVKNGDVTLEGEVASQIDKDRATLLAKHVQFVRNVTDNLVLQK